MESKTKLFGHPIHPMLVVFPLGLLATAVVFDILYLSNGNLAFPTASFYMIATGFILRRKHNCDQVGNHKSYCNSQDGQPSLAGAEQLTE